MRAATSPFISKTKKLQWHCFLRCHSSYSDLPFPSPHPTRPLQQDDDAPKLRPPPSDKTKEQKQENKTKKTVFDDLAEAATKSLKNTKNDLTSLRDQTDIKHHFDTYDLLTKLSLQGFSRRQSEVVMKGIKFRLRESSAYIRSQFLLRSDLDNEMYLFKAAMSELRTEFQMMRRNDMQILQTEGSAVARDMESLKQQLNEDVAMMKNDVTLDMNNHKHTGREEHNKIDIQIQELNNKITVSLGDVRTELEAVRWETIWKGMTGVALAGLGVAVVGYFLTRYADHRASAKRAQKQKEMRQLQEEARHAGTLDMEVVY
ncbi:hypothetical protein BCR43DRAFT_467202 [Syncephalastrum racemosum]|uniref:DUF1640-domain-containing protein n=1 Tax=Syncephalastrum racemosum TaxID=13706 RepID=A0A1X2HVL0_SYNRA|nr:hypothetical protein BCR43DRAFT_467202 [Syncephalastrum racemosum]